MLIYVISDSIGDTAFAVTEAVMEQFPSIEYDVVRFPLTRTKEQINDIIDNLEEGSIILSTIVIKSLREYLEEKALNKGINLIDILKKPIEVIEKEIGLTSKELPGANRQLDQDYFDTISAIEFTIRHDDGVDPRGLLEADIVLLGVSRTSKTPTSLLLATKGYRVMNVPLVPEAKVPDELYEIDRKKIVGLIISVEELNKIRRDRLKALGVNSLTNYAKEDRIIEELNYALEVMDSLKCTVIDVTDKTIHDTANKIESIINP